MSVEDLPILSYFPYSEGRKRSPLHIGASAVRGEGENDLYQLVVVDNEGILVRDIRRLHVKSFKPEAIKLGAELEKRGYKVSGIQTPT